jgi:hypothetical protein
MKKNLYYLLISMTIFTSLIYSCKNSDVTPDDNSVIGVYKIIDNPLLCSLPTMDNVKIKSVGTAYSLTFKHTTTSLNVELSDITVEKTDNTSKLFYKGVEMGKFTSMKYTDWSGGKAETIEGMVLMLNFNNDNKHYEFMGRK